MRMLNNDKNRKKIAVPSEFRRRMQTEHGGWIGPRLTVLSNFFSSEPRWAIASQFDLLEDEFTVLANLNDWGGMTAQVICALSGRPKNSMSRAVSRLTKRGLIDARGDEVDRRCIILTITPAGRDVYEKASEPFRDQEKKMFGCLTKKEAQEMDRLILKILGNWSNEFSDEDASQA